MSKLQQYIESLIFVAESPITEKDMRDSLQSSLKLKASKVEVSETIQKLQKKYKHPNFSFELIALSDGYQFMTKADYHDLVGQYLRIQSKKKLSRAAMETLAIIAYKQPMTKSGIESIRGVNCDYAILKLVEKELIEILGRAQTPGRPILYGTSDKFMDYFGIKDITDLPKLKEIIISENSIGMEAGLEKMHSEGLTEEYQFHPEPEPVNEEVDLSEVSLPMETTEEPAEGQEIKEEGEADTEVETSVAEVEVQDESKGQDTAQAGVEVEIQKEEQNTSELINEEIALPDVQSPVETFDIENINEEIGNEEAGESVNSEEN